MIASGGNAGIAVAVAAQALGVRCEVFVPESSSAAKRAKLAELGAVLTVTGASYADALAASLARQAQSGALLMHAYDQREVVIGAGTLAAEVEEEAGVPDRVLVSVGGGGLIAGIASWFQDRCWIDALEPELAPTLYRAREAGKPVDVAVSGIAADSLGARRIGAIAWEVTRAACGRGAPAGRRRRSARRRPTCGTTLRLAVEPAAALPLAALDHRGPSCRARTRRCCSWSAAPISTWRPWRPERRGERHAQGDIVRRPRVLHRRGPDVPRVPAADRRLQPAPPRAHGATPAGDGIARIRRETGGRGGKTVTVVTGLALGEPALLALCKRLKAACGTGGTVRDGALEFQGDHREQLSALLAKEGIRSKLAGG